LSVVVLFNLDRNWKHLLLIRTHR